MPPVDLLFQTNEEPDDSQAELKGRWKRGHCSAALSPLQLEDGPPVGIDFRAGQSAEVVAPPHLTLT